MYRYRITSTSRGDDMELVTSTEEMGWEFFQIVPAGNRYYYWFRKPLVVVPTKTTNHRVRTQLS